jgi:uncharacterized repeat protein (TIGR01451 family)
MTETVSPVFFAAEDRRRGARLRLVAVAGAAALAVPIGLVSLAAPASAAAGGTTRYVNSMVGHDTENDCTDQAHPCRTLAHAVDVSAAGDTIQLEASGDTPYQGGVTINKDLAIEGAGQSSTMIDGGGITIDGADVTITGVDISGTSEEELGDGIGVFSGDGAGSLHLQQSTVEDYDTGVHVGAGSTATLTDDTLTGNGTSAGDDEGDDGVGLYVSGGSATVTGTSFTGNAAGITVDEGVEAELRPSVGDSTDDLTMTDSQITGSPEHGLELDGVSAKLTRTDVTGNNTAGDEGGIGVFDGELTLTGSHVDGNGTGGLLIQGGSVAASGSTFDDNHVVGEAGGSPFDGVGIGAGGDLTLQSSSASGNDAAGVLVEEGTASIAGSTLDDNGSAASFFGAGLFLVGGSASVTQSTLSDDGSGALIGGGLIAFGGTASVAGSTLSGNDGGIGVMSSGGLRPAARSAGTRTTLFGVPVPSGSLRAPAPGWTPKSPGLHRSLSPNAAELGPAVSVTDSTVSANTYGGTDTEGSGSTLSLVRSTVTRNGGGTLPSGESTEAFGVAAGSGSTTKIAGSVVAGNNHTADIGADCSNGTVADETTGTIVDGGYDVIGTQDHCGFTDGVNHDQVIGTADPGLKPLGFYPEGSPTRTQPPVGAESPVVDQIPVDAAALFTDPVTGGSINLCKNGSTDQRGVTRPQAGNCDVGAAELKEAVANLDVTVTGDANLNRSGDQSSRTGNGLVSYTVKVTNNGPDAAQNVTVSDVLPSTATGPRGRSVLAEFISDNGNCSGEPAPYTASRGQTVTCSLGTIAPNSSKSVTFTFALFSRSRARSPYPFTFTDTASARSSTKGTLGRGSATLTYRMR